MAGPGKPVDLELTIISARDLKNVNWRNGDLRPYAVAWIDPNFKVSTKVDPEGDTNPCWNEKLCIPVSIPIEDAELQIDIVHEKPSEMTKPLIGTARIPLNEFLDEVGFDDKLQRAFKLKRPSGRPQGKLEVVICLREKGYPPPAPYPQPYGSRDYVPPNYPSQWYPYGNNPAPPQGYANPGPVYGGSYAQPGSYGAYGGSYAQPRSYGGRNYYGEGASGYGGQPPPVYEKPQSGKYGVGTGLAVGAVAGVLGGLALAEGVEYVEDKIEDDAVEKVEENFAEEEYYDGDDF